jgi:hypothetical protein
MQRRAFIKTGMLTGAGLMTSGFSFGTSQEPVKKGLRVGIIGLDTSHAIAFTQTLNKENASPDFGGYKIVATYPPGSKDIPSSVERIPEYIREVKKFGVEIVDSIPDLLNKVDVVLLTSNDGRPHLEQAIPVFKAGKTVFIDKPMAGSLTDVYTIFQAAKDFKTPVFSSSSLRYQPNMNDIVNNNIIGRILCVEAYTPCSIEPTHPDLYWYGVHGIEPLFAVLGAGCQTVSRVQTPDVEVATGVWEGDRVGIFRGMRLNGEGFGNYGGKAIGEKGTKELGGYHGYDPLLKEIVRFFQTGVPPVTAEETIEIFAFMDAADESKRRGGAAVSIAETKQKALAQVKKIW